MKAPTSARPTTLLRAAAILALLAGAAAIAQPSTPATEAPATVDGTTALPIRRVTLYRSGMANIERRGEVDGDLRVRLRFDTNTINDVLKSMIVIDASGKGTVGEIAYASREPLSRRLESFGIPIGDNPSLADLLGRLRGAAVTITLDDRTLTGTILGGEQRLEPAGRDQPAVPVPYVTVMTAEGIESVSLTRTRSVRLNDERLRTELTRALAAIAEQRDDRVKALDVALAGGEDRPIVMAYVQESPVWKPTYRLILPTDANAQKAGMQGWAIVENTSDEDWRDVRLALVSGRPVSFRMDVSQLLFHERPLVQVPMEPGIGPREFAGSMILGEPMAPASPTTAAAPGAPPRSAGRGSLARMEARADESDLAELAQKYAQPPMATGTDIGESFEFELDAPVTIERQRSAMIPILAHDLPIRRVSIFSLGEAGNHPMRAVEVTNTSPAPIMPGPIAVFDAGRYAGDALVGHVPAGEKRLVGYATDLDVSRIINPEVYGSSAVTRLRIVRGVLTITIESIEAAGLTLRNADANSPRTVIVEAPRLQGYELIEPAKAPEATEQAYRFEVPLAPAASADLIVRQRRVMLEERALLDLEDKTLLGYVNTGKASPAVIRAFEQIATLRRSVAIAQSQVASLEREREDITRDQDRLRQNMTAVDRASDLYTRYLKTMSQQESRLEALTAELQRAREATTAARRALEDYTASLTLD